MEILFKWDLNSQSLNSVQTFQPTELLGHKFNSGSEPTLMCHFKAGVDTGSF